MMRRHCVGSSNGDEDNKGSQCTATLAQQSNVRKARMSRTAKRDGKKKEDEDSEGGRSKRTTMIRVQSSLPQNNYTTIKCES